MNGRNRIHWCPDQMMRAVDYYLRNVLFQQGQHGFKVLKVDMDGGEFEITMEESDVPGPAPAK